MPARRRSSDADQPCASTAPAGPKRTGAGRQGRRFQLPVEGPVTEAHLESARELAATSLSNPIIEDVVAVYAAEGER